MKKITVMTPCYNEEGNIEDLYLRVKEVFNQLPNYEYEHLFIDNASQDQITMGFFSVTEMRLFLL